MTQELLERTTREWVSSDTGRAARELERLARTGNLHSARSADDIANALIELAGRLEIAHNRAW